MNDVRVAEWSIINKGLQEERIRKVDILEIYVKLTEFIIHTVQSEKLFQK